MIETNNKQERIDQVRYFNQELSLLQQENILQLSDDAKKNIDEYHRRLFADLTSDQSLDLTQNAKSLSIGMRAFTTIAALAMMIFLFLLVQEIWSNLSDALRIVLLIGLSLGSLSLAIYLKRNDAYGYYTQIASVAAVISFVINLVGLAKITNASPSSLVYILVAAYAWLLAHGLRSPILLWIFVLCSYLSLGMFVSIGSSASIDYLFEMPDVFFALPFWLYAVSIFEKKIDLDSYRENYLISGSWFMFVTAMILQLNTSQSSLPFSDESLEWVYMILALMICALTIFIAIKHEYTAAIQHGLIQFTLFILIEFIDRLADYLPDYILFLCLALFAVACVWALKRFHKRELIKRWVKSL